ncbi:MAG: hypothetical protein Q7R47_05230 [Candidatus Diapherotrites archaeon]|nr:hypothetical protein [Candidatus Diapherotrites archaeon]
MFKLPNGPWETVFSTKQPEVEISLQTNMESDVAVQIVEKKGENPTGVVLELFKVFVTSTHPQTLVEKLPFLALEFGVHSDRTTTHWFVLCESGSVYCEAGDVSVAAAFADLAKKVSGYEEQLLAAGRQLDVQLIPFSQSDESERSAFWSSLLVQPLLLERTKSYTKAPEPGINPSSVLRYGEVKLGRGKDQTLFREPLSLFKKTIVLGGTLADREGALRVLIESALLSGVPVVVFDASNKFAGLREQNQNAKQVTDSGFDQSPVGFPTEEFEVPSGVWTNFSDLDIDATLELFRVGLTPSAKVIKMVFELAVAVNWTQLIDTIKIQSPAGDVTRFHLNKAMRIAAVMDSLSQGFFGGPNRLEAMTKTLDGGFGYAGIVKMENLDPRLRLLLVHSLSREFKRFFSHPNKAKPVSVLLVFPDATQLFPSTGHGRIQQVIEDDLLEAANYGVGMVLAAEKAIDLHDHLPKQMTAEIGIVAGHDVGVRIEKRKPYRCELRPPLSRL